MGCTVTKENVKETNTESLPKRWIRRASTDEILIEKWRDAVMHGNDSLMEHFVKENPNIDLINSCLRDGHSSLGFAILKSKRKAVKYLLDNGANVNFIHNKTKDSILHLAIRSFELEFVEWVLHAEPPLDPRVRYHKNRDGRTVIDELRKGRDTEVIQAVREAFKKVQGMQSMHSLQPSIDLGEEIEGLISEDTNGISSSMASVLDLDKPPSDDFQPLNKLERSTTVPVLVDLDTSAGTKGKKKKRRKTLVVSPVHSRDPSREFSACFDDLVSGLGPKLEPNIGSNNPFARHFERCVDYTEFRDKKKALPRLEGWVHKKRSKFPRVWHARYLVVKNQYILWSEKKHKITRTTEEDLKLFHEVLDMIDNDITAEPVTDDASRNNEFIITTSKKVYEWKAENEDIRDCWVEGINEYKRFCQEFVHFLEANQ